MAKIVVGMSGGVDSSVVALLLKQQGHEVIGLFMRNWNDASVTLEDECLWIDDSRDAMMVAEHLGIPFQVLDLSEVYREKIVNYMFAEYQAGRTPNPDILCNREIKFDVFLNEALKLGADFVATGHYVRKGESISEFGEPEFQLLSGKDVNKDQSYFLCQLNQYQLSKALFPIGELNKLDVRQLAVEAGLSTATKKDSQGLCFIGHVRLPDFLQQKLMPKEGEIIEIARNAEVVLRHKINVDSKLGLQDASQWHASFQPGDGKVIAKHQGAHYYTRGQRKGLKVGGKALPLFILQTDVEKNIIYVGQGEDHLGLISGGLFVLKNDAHWVRPSIREIVLNSSDLQCRIRYRQNLFACKLIQQISGYAVVFESPQKAVSSGQFVAIYLSDEIVFSGVIA